MSPARWPALLVAVACLTAACSEKTTPGPTDAAVVADAAGDTEGAADALPDITADAAPDTAPDTGTDAAADSAPDAGLDTADGVDAGPLDVGPACQVAADCPPATEPCQQAACLPTGCTLVAADGAACDDGSACTEGDACLGGTCVPGPSVCACQASADCAAQEDGDLCNGQLYCDKSVLPYVCKVNPATVVTCPDSPGPCLVSACAADTGTCSLLPAPATPACDDGDPCTEGDHCQQGECQSGTQVCCGSDADCAGQEDGDACNGTLFCNKATQKCQLNPATVVSCPSVDDTACSQNLCQPKSGQCQMTAVAEGLPCDDGDPCTANEVCQAGQCQGAGSVCQCQQDADCAAFDDGDLCNGTMYCDKAKAPFLCKPNPATVVVCPSVDDTACAQNQCDAKTGKCGAVFAADGKACDADGNACTPADTCQGGQCVADVNVCDCQATADCAAKDDGDLCNGTLYCDKTQQPHKCAVNPATVVFCPVGLDTACLHHQCQPATGQCQAVPVNQGGACDADGNPKCTLQDVCQQGQCVADANTCECQTDADCGKHDDGDVCNGKLYCDKASNKCVVNPATVVSCPTAFDTVCLQNRCQPASGQCQMTAVHELQHCDADGNACTLYDRCKLGQCVPGANLCQCGVDADCGEQDDGDLCNGVLFCDGAQLCKVNPATIKTCGVADATCQTASCQAKTGQCLISAKNEGQPCDDGAPCTVDEVCTGGQCQGQAKTCLTPDLCFVASCDPQTGACQNQAKDCDDGLPCTVDSCQDLQGCAHAPASGAPCDDGDACTESDACLCGPGAPGGATCACAGKATSCDDGNACTSDTCKASAGCSYTPAGNGAPCTDGDDCSAPDSCGGGTCQAGPAKDCDDGVACTVDSCTVAKGCQHATDAKLCDDGLPCTADVCDTVVKACTHAPAADGTACGGANFCASGTCGWAKGVAAGSGFACAVRTDGSVACWGDDTTGQLGNDKGGSSAVPVPVVGVTDAEAVSAGGMRACARRKSGQVSCWGKAWDGAVQDTLGVGKGNAITVAMPVLDAQGQPFGDVQQVAVGPVHACALDGGGGVWCWGRNDLGQVGDGGTSPVQARPKQVTTLPEQAVHVAVGSDHSCAALLTGEVWCWGANAAGQLGNDATGSFVASPVQALGLTDAEQVAAGAEHTCARRQGGQVACWGSQDQGQVGLGAIVATPVVDVPTPVADLAGVQSVVAAGSASLALGGKGKGLAWGWGANDFGQLGTGGVGDAAAPAPMASLPVALLALATGGDHTCAVDAALRVLCWGKGESGQLGDGKAGSGHMMLAPAVVTGALAVPTELCKLAEGCDDGDACTTDACDPQTGACSHVPDGGNPCDDGDPCTLDLCLPAGGCSHPPAATGTACSDQGVCVAGACKTPFAVALAAGADFTCALQPAGGVQCWGSNLQGQLGGGAIGGLVAQPAPVPGLFDAVALTAYGQHACARRQGGQVLCWGANGKGSLGQDTAVTKNGTPTPVAGLGTASGVGFGHQHGCALQDGTARCWGDNYYGQLGNGESGGGKLSTTALQVAEPTGLVEIATGADHTCARNAAGGLWCWGDNFGGQIGNGACCGASLQASPWPVPGLDDAVEIDLGYEHSCVRRQDDTVWCWGSNAYGATGLGKTALQQKAPAPVVLLGPTQQLSVGAQHGCALLPDGALRCWGANGDKQLGLLTGTGYAKPVAIAGTWRHVAAGGEHTCGIRPDGSVACWGSNASGQLGNGDSGAGKGSVVPLAVVGSGPK